MAVAAAEAVAVADAEAAAAADAVADADALDPAEAVACKAQPLVNREKFSARFCPWRC